MRVSEYLKQYFSVTGRRGAEVQMNCPQCDHPQFYFNTFKKVGFCHRASCGWTPNLKELQAYAPSIAIDDDETAETQKEIVIELPKGSEPIVGDLTENGYRVRDMDAYDYLVGRGLTVEQIKRYKICSLPTRIVVPIYDSGKLVSYVSRQYRGTESGWKYLYPEGGMHGRTFFGWEEAQHWEQLTLVENTFVSLWLRRLNVTTNFGSHLTEDQINKIKYSSVKTVVLLWDEGSYTRADKAIERLRNAGIAGTAVSILGQPDAYPIGYLQARILSGHGNARSGQRIC